MQTLSAKDAKYGFGRLIDLACAEPVVVAKHGRPVVVVMAVEEYERLPSSATFASKAFRRVLKFARSLRNQIERTPLAETKTPRLRSSLLTRTWPWAGYSMA